MPQTGRCMYVTVTMTNPYRPGSEDWHYWNLTGGSVGHIDSVVEDDRGWVVHGTYYDPEALQMANMRVEKPSDVPWELRYSPSREFIEAFGNFGDLVKESQERWAKAIKAMNLAFGSYSIYGPSVQLSRWGRVKWWFYQRFHRQI